MRASSRVTPRLGNPVPRVATRATFWYNHGSHGTKAMIYRPFQVVRYSYQWWDEAATARDATQKEHHRDELPSALFAKLKGGKLSECEMIRTYEYHDEAVADIKQALGVKP